MNISKIGQIAIPVKDLGRSIEFYKDVLDLPLLFQTNNMAFLSCNGIRLLLNVTEIDGFKNASSIIYFQVQDIIMNYKSLKSKGVQFIDEPHVVAKVNHTETWMTFFNDTEGNTHALMSEIILK